MSVDKSRSSVSSEVALSMGIAVLDPVAVLESAAANSRIGKYSLGSGKTSAFDMMLKTVCSKESRNCAFGTRLLGSR